MAIRQLGMSLEAGASIENYIVSGTITGSRRVPEPATVLMLALGIVAARCSRISYIAVTRIDRHDIVVSRFAA